MMLEKKDSTFSNRHRRNKSVLAMAENVLHNGIFNDYSQGQINVDDSPLSKPKKRIITHYPPPPYLPGELERRAIIMNEDSEVERINARLNYEKELFHYF